MKQSKTLGKEGMKQRTSSGQLTDYHLDSNSKEEVGVFLNGKSDISYSSYVKFVEERDKMTTFNPKKNHYIPPPTFEDWLQLNKINGMFSNVFN